MTLTREGFKPKRLPEIKDGIERDLSDAFGDPDLRSESVWGQQIGIYSELQALMWQLAEDVYLSQYPDTATGVSLDHVASLTGIVRIPATPTQVVATAYGDLGVRLLAGREARNRRTGDVYRSVAAVTINADDAIDAVIRVGAVADGDYTVTIDGSDYTYAASDDDGAAILSGIYNALSTAPVQRSIAGSTIIITADAALGLEVTANITISEVGVPATFVGVETGAKILPAGDLSEITTPVSGWNRISNPDEGITGTDRETDGQLRARRERSIQITATNTLDAIYARLRQVPLVTDVNVRENNSSTTDEDGTPRQHVWAIVEGGDDDDIAAVLYNAVAGGIGYRGDVDVTVTSAESGMQHMVKFDRPSYIDPVIEIEIIKLSGFPPNGEDAIRDALTARIFVLGEKLIRTQLFTPINSVPGVQVTALTIDGTEQNILPSPNEKVRILAAKITVTEAE